MPPNIGMTVNLFAMTKQSYLEWPVTNKTLVWLVADNKTTPAKNISPKGHGVTDRVPGCGSCSSGFLSSMKEYFSIFRA